MFYLRLSLQDLDRLGILRRVCAKHFRGKAVALLAPGEARRKRDVGQRQQVRHALLNLGSV